MADFWEGFKQGYVSAIKTFYPGVALCLVVFFIAKATA